MNLTMKSNFCTKNSKQIQKLYSDKIKNQQWELNKMWGKSQWNSIKRQTKFHIKFKHYNERPKNLKPAWEAKIKTDNERPDKS